MAFKIRRVDYFNASVEDVPGEGHRFLSRLADLGVNLLAFTAVPIGPGRTQLTLFPEDGSRLQAEARRIGLTLDGPHPALMAHGDDRLGVLAEIHSRLSKARVNIYASSGVTDGEGCFGYVIYVRPEDVKRAEDALEV